MSEEKEAKKGFGEKLLNKLGFETVEDEEPAEEPAEVIPAAEEKADVMSSAYEKPQREEKKSEYTATSGEPQAGSKVKEEEDMEFERISGSQKDNYSLNADNFTGVNAQVILIETEKIKDVMLISDELKSGKTVVINVEKLEKLDVIRLYDFLSGVTYVLGGKMKEISENVIVVAPKNVEIKMTVSVPDDAREPEAFEPEADSDGIDF